MVKHDSLIRAVFQVRERFGFAWRVDRPVKTKARLVEEIEGNQIKYDSRNIEQKRSTEA